MSSRISSSRITFFLFLSFPPKCLNHRSEMEQILLWIRVICPNCLWRGKQAEAAREEESCLLASACVGTFGQSRHMVVCVKWKCQISEGRGEQSVQTGLSAEQRVHHGPDSLPALSLPWERQGMLGWQLEKTLSLRGDTLQEVFVQSLQTDAVLYTNLSDRIQAWQTKRQQLQIVFIQYTNSHQKLTLPFLFLQNHKPFISSNSSIYLFWKDFS